MPMRTYMVVDRRHDHSFRVPRPDRRLPQNPLTDPGKASTNYPRQPHLTEGRLELRNGGFGPPAIGTVPAPMYCKPRHAIGGAIVASMSLVVVTFASNVT